MRVPCDALPWPSSPPSSSRLSACSSNSGEPHHATGWPATWRGRSASTSSGAAHRRRSRWQDRGATRPKRSASSSRRCPRPSSSRCSSSAIVSGHVTVDPTVAKACVEAYAGRACNTSLQLMEPIAPLPDVGQAVAGCAGLFVGHVPARLALRPVRGVHAGYPLRRQLGRDCDAGWLRRHAGHHVIRHDHERRLPPLPGQGRPVQRFDRLRSLRPPLLPDARIRV